MAYSLVSERPRAASQSTRSVFGAVAAWWKNLRRARVQRLTLTTLRELDDARLADIGIERQDLFDAMHAPTQRPGQFLNARRARNAREWTPPCQQGIPFDWV